MNIDSSGASAVAAAESGTVDVGYAVSVLRKAQDQQRSVGAQAVRLIDAAGPQMTKTADGHISVRA